MMSLTSSLLSPLCLAATLVDAALINQINVSFIKHEFIDLSLDERKEIKEWNKGQRLVFS